MEEPVHEPVARRPIGANSLLLRSLIAGAVVAVIVALGLLLHLTLDEYQLLGVPILLGFQLGVHRQPIRTLWLRAGPPFRVDAAFVVIWILLSLAPAYQAVTALSRPDLGAAAFGALAVVGAFGLTYALRAMRRDTVRQLVLCMLTVGAIGILPALLAALLPQVLHLHIRGAPGAAAHPGLLPTVQAAAGTFLLLPVGFVVEEVLVRGGLDTYVHRGERGTGWLSAVYVSALWGVWHLPGSIASGGGARLPSTIAGLVVAQVLVGVPLSLWWRKTGNLLVTDAAHGLLEAGRTVLGVG
jgi:hypothetical protein